MWFLEIIAFFVILYGYVWDFNLMSVTACRDPKIITTDDKEILKESQQKKLPVLFDNNFVDSNESFSVLRNRFQSLVEFEGPVCKMLKPVRSPDGTLKRPWGIVHNSLQDWFEMPKDGWICGNGSVVLQSPLKDDKQVFKVSLDDTAMWVSRGWFVGAAGDFVLF